MCNWGNGLAGGRAGGDSHQPVLSENWSSGAAATSVNVWLAGMPSTENARRLTLQETLTSTTWAPLAQSAGPTGCPPASSSHGGGGGPRAQVVQVGLRRGLRRLLHASVADFERGLAHGVARGGADLAARAHPLPARRHQQEQQREGGRGDHELDRHRPPVPGRLAPVRFHPQFVPWLAAVLKHSTGPLTVSVIVSGKMPVSLPLTVSDTVFVAGSNLTCETETSPSTLVSRPW